MNRLILTALAAVMLAGCGKKAPQAETQVIEEQAPAIVVMHTTEGDIMMRLYNETPKHRDNFLKLIDEHVYDSLLFHRVISGFVIQGGDPDSKYAPQGVMLGEGGLPYTIPSEIRTQYGIRHKKGALAAARQADQVNPRRESSSTQFYICCENLERLDDQYTVFGQVINGMDVVERIEHEETDSYDRPLRDIRILSIERFGE